MAATPSSHRRRISLFRSLFLESIRKCPFPYLSPLRYYSSEPPNHNIATVDDDDHLSVKPKSSTKTKRAKTMARLINNKPWSSDLESSLTSLSPTLSKTTVLQTLRLIRTSSNALHFFDWTQQNGFTHDDQSFFLVLEILGRTRNLNAARNFLFSIPRRSNNSIGLVDKYFNSLIRSYARAGLFQESMKVFSKMRETGISPSVVTFNSLFLILLKRGRTGMVYNLYDEMLSTYGVAPDTFTFNILIRGFSMNSKVDEGFRFFKEMKRFKCDPDVVTYNTLVDGLCRAGKVKIAHNVIKGMLKKDLNLKPNVVSYTTLIRGIVAFVKHKKLDKIKEIFEGTGGDGVFVPDTCTFNTLMNAHCNAQNLDEALKVFEKMTELRVRPDSATYSVLIRNLCQKGDFERAEQLFDELAEKEILLLDVGCKPLVAAYNPMFEYLCRNGRTKKAETVFRQLMKRGTQDPPAYKTLIMGHCREGNCKAAHDLLVFMLRRDFVPDVETYESLIDSLLQKGEPNLAHDTLERMLKSSHIPKTSTFHSILAELVKKGSARESASLVALMLERKIRQNIDLSQTL
ncbi:unnamed protein product [Ilex paraguariensis]|uniref:Pentatricopeptide repeat-containing protein n=1 Tax=Ilex paraguariensis TaxID=185542 RepID=A0ABC8QRQ6_9AQUA